MKKITLLAAFVMVFSFTNAQTISSNPKSLPTLVGAKTIAQPHVAVDNTYVGFKYGSKSLASQPQFKMGSGNQVIMAIGDTLWSEDFAAGIPSGWVNNGNPSGATWEYRGPATTPDNTLGGRGDCSGGAPIASPTAANGFVIFDSNYLDGISPCNPGSPNSGVAPPPHTGTLQTAAIDLTGVDFVQLSFSYFLRNFTSTQTVFISNDGGTVWTEIWEAGVATNASSANPATASIDVSCFAGNQSDVRLQFVFDGTQGYYEWMLDDVVLTEAVAMHDLAIDDAIYMDPWLTPVYTMIPYNQADTIDFSAWISNAMPFIETNVVLEVVADDGVNNVFSAQSSPTTVNGCSDSTVFAISPGFTPYGLGMHTFNFSLIMDSTDADPSDNTFAAGFEVTDTVYARDNGAPLFELNAAAYGSTNPYEFANWFETPNADVATSISVQLGAGTVVGTVIRGKIYDDQLPTPTELETTAFYTVQAGDPGNWLTLSLNTNLNLTAQSNYIVSIAEFSSTDTAFTVMGTNVGVSPFATAWLYSAGSWGPIVETPSIRLNLADPGNICALSATSGTMTAVSCNGAGDGAISGVTGSGGTTPYTYLWSPGGATTPDISGLAPGIYTVAISDAAGCEYAISVDVTEPNALSVIDVITDITCNGMTNGSVNASATGGNLVGSAAITYFSDDFESATPPAMPAGWATFDVDGLTPNAGVTPLGFDGTNATAWVTGDDGSGSNNVAISNSWYTAPGTSDDWMISPAINIGATNVILSWDAQAVDANFPDGYEVRISTTTQTVAGCLANPLLFTIPAENPTLTNRTVDLTAAGYASQTVYIAFRNTSTDQFLSRVDNILVESPAVASAYQYSFDGGAYSTTSSFSGLGGGTYNLIVQDASGCMDSVDVVITEPAAITFALNTSTAVCGLNGSGTVTPAGGTAPFTYIWDDPNTQTDSTATGLLAGTYNITVTDAMGCIDTAMITVTGTPAVIMTTGLVAPTSCTSGDGIAYVSISSGTAPFGYQWSPTGGFSDSATGLSAGIYTILVIDSFGCQSTGSVTMIDAGAPNINVTGFTDVTCFGGSDGDATASISGGTGPYDYYWSNGDSTIGGGLTNLVTGLSAGSYDVTVTDAGSCSNFASTTISEPSTGVSADSITSADISCNGLTDGTATVSASGGTAPLTYSWTSGGSTATVAGLGAGTEMVTIADANGCSDSASVTITEPAAIVANAVNTNIKCNGDGNGLVDLTASGGTPPLAYLWSNGATTEDLSGLSPGNFTVTVTDASGCPQNAFASITEPPVLVVLAPTVTDETATGANDGTITVNTPTGGTQPYGYGWQPGGLTTQNISGLSPGAYTLTVTDANNCTATVTDTVMAAPIGIEEVAFDLTFNVYPNPNDGNFVVKIQNLKGDDYNLEVRNIIGQLVYADVISDITGGLNKEVNMKGQNRGVYFLSIINEEGKRTEKLIIF